jgi:hypothetical protein
MRCVSLPIEDLVAGSRHVLWREAQLHERPDIPGKQIVIELVDLRPVIAGSAVLYSDRAERIVKDRMEPDVTKTEFVDRCS